MTPATTTERPSPRELVVTRIFDAPPHLVFKAWTTPALFLRWWAPKSFGITFLSCDIDARTGGSYRFVFGHPATEQPMAFHGRYLEVVPDAKLVWTNEESPEGQVSTLTLEDLGGRTRLVLHELYPSVEALDEAMESGANGAYPEQFDALDGLLAPG
ncbi:MAG: SRPBCC family protein [Rhodobacterales bacterium]|nr:SRPBCC family protein [Rhodobacterales bacterium]